MKCFELVHFQPLPEMVENPFDRIAFIMQNAKDLLISAYWPNTETLWEARQPDAI